ALQEAYSTPIFPLDILAERLPEKKFEWAKRLVEKYGSLVSSDMQSLVFLVIANGMAACYSLLQGGRCLVSILTGGGVLINRPMAWAIFSCDQVMAYFTISAVAVAMEAAMIGKY
ncbi:DUF588 domain-containing protein, partial [Salmonella enterica subsp. enterica serovar 1,4,[5],12:i:-]|nr:DUF588 domain-containing protein [Salmonella enterica subsp. enterica serovar 1,4,[5],12:i:-]